MSVVVIMTNPVAHCKGKQDDVDVIHAPYEINDVDVIHAPYEIIPLLLLTLLCAGICKCNSVAG